MYGAVCFLACRARSGALDSGHGDMAVHQEVDEVVAPADGACVLGCASLPTGSRFVTACAESRKSPEGIFVPLGEFPLHA